MVGAQPREAWGCSILARSCVRSCCLIGGTNMPAQVAIIHGWSDSSASFGDLRDFLEANGYSAHEVWLADYVSMEDDVRIEDAAKGMHQVITSLIASNDLADSFDLIVHSTGGLLARQWIISNYPDGARCPVKRLVMLAPA